jgi:GNAT superfamily N-acetyltransferase
MLSADTAIDVFIKSFAYTRSFTHPIEIIPAGALRVIRDAPRQRGTRTEEIVAAPGITPEAIVAQVQAYQPTNRYLLDVFQTGEVARDVNVAFTKLGYRCLSTEVLMALDLNEIPRVDAMRIHAVQRVTTEEQLTRMTRVTRRHLIYPVHLAEPDTTVRAYYVERNAEIVAWGRTVLRHPDASYVAGLYTQATYRRQGIASSIMQRMLIDDANQGVAYSVLLASHTGAHLYTHLGYQQLGMLHMFAPRVRKTR